MPLAGELKIFKIFKVQSFYLFLQTHSVSLLRIFFPDIKHYPCAAQVCTLFFIDCQSLRELRITGVLIIAITQKRCGLKCNGLVIFSHRGGISKYNTCVFPPCHPPPCRLHLLSLAPPPPPQAPLLLSGTSLTLGLRQGCPKKGDPSNATGGAGIFDGSEPWENSVGA